MYLQKPVSVDLLLFITQGRFDCVLPGQTKEWILNNFLDPDSQNDMGHNMSIWLYGNIEFHFEGEMLFLIHCDNFHLFGAGDGIALNKWVLSKNGDVMLKDVLEELHKHKVSYAAHYNRRERSLIIQIAMSKVQLYFSLDDEADYDSATADNFIFDAFSLLHSDCIRKQN